MQKKKPLWLIGLLLLAGCATMVHPRAVLNDRTLENPALGFSGFRFQIPEGFTLYTPDAADPATYNDLQHMAIRIRNLEAERHPRGNELFYESFLLLSEKCCFLLVTVKSDRAAVPSANSSFGTAVPAEQELLPLYNATQSRTFELGPSRHPAVFTRGSAFEKEGWYYSRSSRHAVPFNYEACKISGANRDHYVLLGFARPEEADELSEPLRTMVESMEL